MPYLIPSSPQFEDELECLLVFYPNRVEYRQALLGAYTDLTKQWNWEGTPAERKDVVDSWDLAVLETLNGMGKLDDIIDLLEAMTLLIDEIEPLLRNAQPCCPDGGGQYGDLPDYDLSGTGDVPQAIIDAGYATDAADWDGYADYKCMAAHILVDNLEATLQAWAGILDGPGKAFISFATVAATLWVTALTGGGAIVILGGLAFDALSLWKILEAIDDWTAAGLTSAVDDVEDARDSIVCAAVNADGLAAIKTAVDAALDSELSALLATILKLANTNQKITYYFAGYYNGQDAAQALADYGADPADYDCNCAAPPIAKLSGTFYGTCSSHSVGDNVAENESIDLVSGAYAGHYALGVSFSNPDGDGPILGLGRKMSATAVSGWSNATGHDDRYVYSAQATSPFYYGPTTDDEFNWGAATPILFIDGNGAAFYALSDTPFTMTIQIHDTWYS